MRWLLLLALGAADVSAYGALGSRAPAVAAPASSLQSTAAVGAGARRHTQLAAGNKASKDGPFKVIAKNKQAYRNYEILETFEAGIELLGTEVKSARGGRCSIDEGYAAAKRGECVLHGVHIAPHATSNAYDQHEAKRPRRLLLHKREIKRLEDMTSRAGYTAVPLTLYFNHKNLLKISVALARGKNERDKRDDIQQREAKRDLQRAVKAW